MTSDDANLEASLTTLRDRFAHAFQYDALVELEKDLRDLALVRPSAIEPVMMIGKVMQRRLEWDLCSRHYLSSSAAFDDNLEMRYEAGLTAIDAGSYGRGRMVFAGLAGELDALSERQLRGFWRAAPLVGLYQEGIDAYRRWLNHQATAPDQAVELRLRRAAENAASAAIRSVGVISLGENCLPWLLGQRWGLRPSESFIGQESPFNLAQTVTDSVSSLLTDGLYPLLSLQSLTTGLSEQGTQRPLNHHYRFDFNHEWGLHFIEHRFGRLVDRYAERVGSLRRFLTSDAAIYVHYTERDGDLTRLAEAVRKAVAHDNYRLVIFDVWDGERSSLPTDGNTIYTRVMLPRADYVWYRPDDLDSVEGVAFEQQLQDIIVTAVASVHEKVILQA